MRRAASKTIRGEKPALCGKTSRARDNMKVQTVLGPIDVDQLGRTLMHEHLFIAFPGAEFDPAAVYDRAAFVAEAVRRLIQLRTEHGVKSFVDPCPIELGRDVSVMAEIAERSQMIPV